MTQKEYYKYNSIKNLSEIYKQQNRGYKSDKKWKSTETLINKGLEAKKHQNRDKTKCTKYRNLPYIWRNGKGVFLRLKIAIP